MVKKYFPGMHLSCVWIGGYLHNYGLEFIVYPPFYFPACILFYFFTEERKYNLLVLTSQTLLL